MDGPPINYIRFSSGVDESPDTFFVVVDELHNACQRGYKQSLFVFVLLDLVYSTSFSIGIVGTKVRKVLRQFLLRAMGCHDASSAL